MFSGRTDLRMMALGRLGRARDEIRQGMGQLDPHIPARGTDDLGVMDLYEWFAKIDQLMTDAIEEVLDDSNDKD